MTTKTSKVMASAAGASPGIGWCAEGDARTSVTAPASCRPDYFPIDSYGVIGDLHTAALVNPHGGIDWACFPIFDSPSSFARILDERLGGTFAVYPVRFAASELSYQPRTNILRTDFWSDGATARLVDFMPILSEDGHRPDPDAAYICREVVVHGLDPIELEVELDPSPDYARDGSFLEPATDGMSVRAGELTLLTSRPVAWDSDARLGRVTLSPGERLTLVLCAGSADVGAVSADVSAWYADAFERTERYWKNWISQCHYEGLWQDIVERSALALKLLTFKPTGAIIAAATTSLPEGIGGPRNWDYRFSWLRDSALTLNALFLLGFAEEAEEFVRWMISLRPGRDQPIKILHPISQKDTTKEFELSHLSGYRGSRPVRIGNAAVDQVQLDVYGEVIDTLFLYSIFCGPLDDGVWDYVCELADRICAEWHERDEGIWEVRGEPQNYTYSKLMCWVGLDRALRIGRDQGFEGPFDRWESEMETIRSYVLENCVHAEKRFLTQSAETHAADASNLLAPILSFLDPNDEIAKATVDETLENLTKDGLVYRYLTDDGLRGPEGAFNICTFWLVEALAMVGRLEDAHEIFRGMLELTSHLGLYAEQTDLNGRIALGNFPQAFSHVGMINSALTLNAAVQQSAGRSILSEEDEEGDALSVT